MLALLSIAWACVPTADSVLEARALFDDAEIDDARKKTQQALDELPCQTAVVERGTLLELFRLDGQIALASLDKKGATYATIRSVVIDPTSVPPVDYGSDLADLHRLWGERLAGSTVMLSVSGGGVVYLDGLPLTQGERRQAVRGEHLVQIDSGTRVVSTVTDLDKDQAVITGISLAASPIPVPQVPVPLVDLDAPEQVKKRRRKPSPLVMVTGGALAAVGGACLGTAWYRDEIRFKKKVFADADAVDREATLIRALYGTGYGLGGVGLVAFGVGAVGSQVRLEGTWRF